MCRKQPFRLYITIYLILSNLYCKLYYLFLLAKKPRKVDDLLTFPPMNNYNKLFLAVSNFL